MWRSSLFVILGSNFVVVQCEDRQAFGSVHVSGLVNDLGQPNLWSVSARGAKPVFTKTVSLAAGFVRLLSKRGSKMWHLVRKENMRLSALILVVLHEVSGKGNSVVLRAKYMVRGCCSITIS